jgi:hypothetical protein
MRAVLNTESPLDALAFETLRTDMFFFFFFFFFFFW